MKNRQKHKALKEVAIQEAANLEGFDYKVAIRKIVNEVGYIVEAQNRHEEIVIFIDRLNGPFNTWLTNKPGVLKI